MTTIGRGIRGRDFGIAGSGVIACGLAAVAASTRPVVMWTRSEAAAARAVATVRRIRDGFPDRDAGFPIRASEEITVLRGADVVIEAIAEEAEAKTGLLTRLREVLSPATLVATTTSSLSVATLAEHSGLEGRLIGFHVFNPVPRMDLIEVVVPDGVERDFRRRAFEIAEEIGKIGVEVPDAPGFVVNRLLFPFLCDAVRLMERHHLPPEAVDRCMTLGARHPLGPLALLDMVGLDVSRDIMLNLGLEVPASLEDLVALGRLGRKVGAGFYEYQ